MSEKEVTYTEGEDFVFVENDEAPPHATPQMAKLIVEMGTMMNNNDGRGLVKMRRNIRRRLFRIRDALIKGQEPSSEHDSGLRAWMELQFLKGHHWFMQERIDGRVEVAGGFTFDWDVSAKEPLKLITQFEWDGGFDGRLNEVSKLRVCVPPAFTKQG